MNMQFLPWTDNFTPDLDEDDPDRRKYLKKVRQIHTESIGNILAIDMKNDNIGSLGYLSQRVRFMTYLALMLFHKRISKERYKEFAQMQNGDILYSRDFQENFDIRDYTWKSISECLAEYSTW